MERDWLALPTGVLRCIITLASAWQAPGPCLAAPVCRTWRTAAAGCRGIRLLYHAGRRSADESLCTWMGRYGQQVDAIMFIKCFCTSCTLSADLVVGGLADAAAAAQAAGAPLPLRILRLRRMGAVPSLQLTGRLLATLPNLRCLQLDVWTPSLVFTPTADEMEELLAPLAPLKQATQLQALHLSSKCVYANVTAQLLPPSLRRLTWRLHMCGPYAVPDLSHLTQLTFLRLEAIGCSGLTSAMLPPSLQQLELRGVVMSPDVLREQQGLLTVWEPNPFTAVQLRQLQSFTRLTRLTITMVEALQPRAVCSVLAQHSKLRSLKFVWCGPDEASSRHLQLALATAGSISNLCSLALWGVKSPVLSGLSALTGITCLLLNRTGWFRNMVPTILPGPYSSAMAERCQAWADEVGRMVNLRYLSVPDVLLAAGPALLGGLQQLRVLVVFVNGSYHVTTWSTRLLEVCSQEALLPRLQVLGVSGMTADQAASLQLHRRLQGMLCSRGCEVVVGMNLDDAADPTQQLAGLPESLQQALS